jgi:hypothetical protein
MRIHPEFHVSLLEPTKNDKVNKDDEANEEYDSSLHDVLFKQPLFGLRSFCENLSSGTTYVQIPSGMNWGILKGKMKSTRFRCFKEGRRAITVG